MAMDESLAHMVILVERLASTVIPTDTRLAHMTILLERITIHIGQLSHMMILNGHLMYVLILGVHLYQPVVVGRPRTELANQGGF